MRNRRLFQLYDNSDSYDTPGAQIYDPEGLLQGFNSEEEVPLTQQSFLGVTAKSQNQQFGFPEIEPHHSISTKTIHNKRGKRVLDDSPDMFSEFDRNRAARGIHYTQDE